MTIFQEQFHFFLYFVNKSIKYYFKKLYYTFISYQVFLLIIRLQTKNIIQSRIDF